MIQTLDAVLSAAEAQEACAALEAASFADGKSTAGWHARGVKANTQLSPDDPAYRAVTRLVEAGLARHASFTRAVLPRHVRMIVNRYGPGDAYGTHVDDAFMGDQRSDVSFTLFLSPPESYDGGALEIDTGAGTQSIRLPAGAAVVYPASRLHRVTPVTRGVRFAVAGWVESLVRDPDLREILFEIDTVRRSIFARDGKSDAFDLLSKAHSNLLRRFGG